MRKLLPERGKLESPWSEVHGREADRQKLPPNFETSDFGLLDFGPKTK